MNYLHLNHQVTIETPNYPKNYPNKAKCNWKIMVPAGEEVHIWCENFDVVRGDFLRVSGKNLVSFFQPQLSEFRC